MRQDTRTIYTFDELSDDAKRNARYWWLSNSDNEDSFETICEDASQIGLEIISLDDNRPNKGQFKQSALSVALSILENHGSMCETYKTAASFLKQRHIQKKIEKIGDFLIDDTLQEGFLQSLLEDYRIMLNKDIEYQQSDECVDELLQINEYEFTEDGVKV